MRELIEKVRQQGLDRNIVYAGAEGQDKQAMMEAQARYTLKETAELLDAYADQDIDKINDAIGDILVTLIVGASSDCEIHQYFEENITKEMFSIGFIALDESFSDAYIDLLSQNLSLERLCESGRVSDLTYNMSVLNLDVVLDVVNREYNQKLSLKDCLETAYSEIKDRKGKVVNGQFIKDK